MLKLREPKIKTPQSLFEYSIRKVHLLGEFKHSYSHQVWANKIFDFEKKPNIREDYMSVVKREYSIYFDGELIYSFNEEKIKSNFPSLFDSEDNSNIFEKINHALKAEFNEQKNPKNRKSYRVSDLDLISIQEDFHVYKSHLIIEEGDDPHFSESMPIEFKTSEKNYYCAVIEFDYSNGILFFSTDKSIFLTKNSRIISDATINTIALINLFDEISDDEIKPSLPLFKLMNGMSHNIKSLNYSPYPSYLNQLLNRDMSQFNAFKAALEHDLTFIWGPPGTGKSYTLAAIIMALHQMIDERTLVCCLSNVAVDQLVNKVINIIEVNEPEMSPGVFYRAGRSQDSKILSTDFMFPIDSESKRLRNRIKILSLQLEKYKKINKQYSDFGVSLKAKLNELREKLKDHTDYLVSQVRVVFSTISNFVINPRLKNSSFDNLIVDEASMLALPQLIALARNVKKRIILVGDFQQLAPITIAGIPILRKNIFELSGIDINHTHHPGLYQLLNQRRSNPQLVEIVNHSFYNDNLNANNKSNSSIVASPPYSGCVIGMYSVPEGKVRFTRGGTRQNIANAEAVMKILDKYSEEYEDIFSIGIITPYKGQTALLRVKFIERGYDQDFHERVKIGTVHTFQGSECDVIIFDMVDSCSFEKGTKTYVGKIYAGTQGEQLLNVAISRARHKLIVVCDPSFIKNPPGNKITDKSLDIFKRLLKFQNTEF